MGIKVLSLFDGISCGMVALERAGIEVDKYDAYEIEESAIKISEHNYPHIIHKGDVFKAEYKENEYDLLIGGSPCTYWSIAQKSENRETTSSGLGWELFRQYVRALKHITIPSEKQYYSVLNSMGGDVSKAENYFSQMLNNIVSEIRILNSLSDKGIQNIVRYYENDITASHSPTRYDIYILMEYWCHSQ